VGAELVNETAGIDSKLVPAQYHSWGHQVDTSYVERRDNAYLVTGTRVSLDSIVYAFLTGASAETIAQAFPILSLEQVYGAIAFYLAQREEVDRYLATRAKDFDALREASRKADPFFYQKLADVRRGIEPIR
jgi:uncharacterized protein (DUF433 family)